KADLSYSHLIGTDLTSADLTEAALEYSIVKQTCLDHAILNGARLGAAHLFQVTAKSAQFDGARLLETTFSQVALTGATFTGAHLDGTTFNATDLSVVLGLETVNHIGPSSVGIETFYRSKGKIPDVFLRGCGVPEDFITYARSLVTNPIEYYSCFISHSSKDKNFADRLHADLQAKYIRCWYAPEDLKIGEKFRVRIEESIRIYDKIMIVLSENSIQSAWVEDEVEAALERERQNPGSLVLFPIRLDDAVMETKEAWAASLRRTRHIGDFSNWKNHDAYQKSFERLLRDLKSQTKAAPEE